MYGYICRSPPPACQYTGGVPIPPPPPARSGGEDRLLGSAAGPMALASIRKNVFLMFQLWKFSDTQFRRRVQSLRLSRLLTRLSGYQAVAKISWHGELLPPFSSWLHPCFAALDCSPEGQPQNAAVARCGRGGFSRSKPPPHQSCATSAPFPQAELSLATDASNSHIGGIMQPKSSDH
jgi:hypothetical protein